MMSMRKGAAAAGFVLCAMVCAAGEWDAALAEWDEFCRNFEPDYSDGSKYLLPPEGNRFDEPFVVVKDGKPAAKIAWKRDGWWPHDALSTDVTKKAAEELQALVKKLTGVEVPLVGALDEGPDLPVIGVGKGVFFPFDLKFNVRPNKRFSPEEIKTVNADLKALRGTDGFAIRRFGRDLFVYGTCEKGAMNGVYRLVENNTDIIFTRPDEAVGTVFTPLKGNLSLAWGRDVVEKPSMAMREFWNYRPSRYRAANYLTTTSGAEWTDEKPYCRGGHNSSQFVPPASERPDLHGLVSGKRGDYGYMLCFSNPDLKPVYREMVLSHMDHRASPRMSGMHIYLDDTKNWCECEGCAKPLRLPDGTVVAKDDPAFQCTQWFDLLNDSAVALGKAYPGMKINTLAYFQTVVPPKCGVADNIVVGYCPYPRGNDLAPVYAKSNIHFLDNLVGWSRKVPKERMWMYGYDELGMAFPRPLAHTHSRDWKLYAKYLRGMRHEPASYASHDRTEKDGKPSKSAVVFDYSAIELWVMCRLMWNLDDDVEGLYKKFCYRAYREAAKSMERFYGTIRRAFLRRGLSSSITENGLNATKVYIIDGGLEGELRGYLEEAAKSVRHPVAAELVKRVRGRFEHYINEIKSAKTSALVVPLQDRASPPGFDDADWVGAGVIDRLYVPAEADNKGKGEAEGRCPARIDLTQDGKSLYVRATLWEDMDKIVSSPGKPGTESIFGSAFEFFVSDNSNPGSYHLFRIDSAGNFGDYEKMDRSWNSKGAFHDVKRFPDRWVVVLRIPFEEIGVNLMASDKVTAAFLRTRRTFTPEAGEGRSEEEYSGWKYNWFHKVTSFGTLTLQR